MPNATAGAQDGPEERRHHALGDSEHDPRDQGSGDRAEPREHCDCEHLADVEPPDRRLDRDDDDQQRAGHRSGRETDPESELLDLDRVRAHELQGQPVLGDRHDRASVEGARHVEVHRTEHDERDAERHQHAGRYSDRAELQVLPDIGRLHGPEVHAVDEDEPDLDDEHDAEEEGEAAQRFIVLALEALVGRSDRLPRR